MTDQFDVAILGAGFEGSMLATILAYKGAKVVLIDAGTHPGSPWANLPCATPFA